jgi:hypothetical protein
MGNSDQHLHYDVPHVPTGNLPLSILDRFDISVDKFGDSTGRLDGV